MRVTLKIRPSTRVLRETVAWFIAGDRPDNWLRELDRWDTPLDSLELSPIPRSTHEPTPLGVLVKLAWKSSSGRNVIDSGFPQTISTNRLPYGRVANHVYLPIDAEIDPPLNDDELVSLLPNEDADFVWHPSAGFFRIESTERLQIVDLLKVPNENQVSWDHAVPGISFRSRLISVEADMPLTTEDLYGPSSTEIGSQNSSLDQLPPTSNEWFGGKLNQWTKPLRDAVRSMQGKQKPESPSDPNATKPSNTNESSSKGIGGAGGFLGGVGSFLARGLGIVFSPFAIAGGVISQLASGMARLPLIDQISRNREIERLMSLLQKDPDEGLRFALPMDAGTNSRGLANPQNRLVRRDIGFDMNRLGGGGPADFWHIPAEQQYKLIQQYRELAARETRLGRHRRAAFIYAELLGDFVSAAGALEAGNHFREAAVLYRDRLKRPFDAARCLERAGLLDEAVDLYLELGLFEQAANLYERLQRPDEAQKLLRSWVDHLISIDDLKNATRVLHDKLHDVDGALKVLSDGWPGSSSALWCLEESFVMLGLHARHDAALKLIGQLRSTSASVVITKHKARALSGVTIDYPERTVQLAAAEATQVVVASVLARSSLPDTTELLGAIRRLAPQDRLLSRDCDRYVKIRQERSRPKAKSRAASRGISEVNAFKLSLENVSWRIARSAGKSAYVAGYENRSLVLQRLYWNNLTQQNHRAFWYSISDVRPLILEPFPGDGGGLIIHPIGADPINQRGLPTNRGTMTMAGSPSWATKSTVAIAYNQGGIAWRIREVFGTLEITSINPKGEPLRVLDLAIPAFPESVISSGVHLSATINRLRVGTGPHVYIPEFDQHDIDGTSSIKVTTLNSNIQYLTYAQNSSNEEHNCWLVALFETGGILLDDDDHETRFPISEDLENPCATFLAGGRLIIAGTSEVHAYIIETKGPRLIGKAALESKPISITGTDNLGEFAVFGEDGHIQIFVV